MPLEEEKEVREKPKSKKLLILLVLSAVLLGAGGAGAYYFKFARTSDVGTEEKKQDESTFYEMDTFMVNLADAGGKRYLKATIKLRVTSNNTAEECKVRNFELRDLVLTLLTGKEADEVILPQDKVKLKKEIIGAVNHALLKGQVQDVYFTEFLVQ